jgi:hypothetical protein
VFVFNFIALLIRYFLLMELFLTTQWIRYYFEYGRVFSTMFLLQCILMWSVIPCSPVISYISKLFGSVEWCLSLISEQKAIESSTRNFCIALSFNNILTELFLTTQWIWWFLNFTSLKIRYLIIITTKILLNSA